MHRSSAILTLIAVLSCGAAAAVEGGFGVGVIVGEPTGISLKKWLGSSTAIDGAVSWSLDDGREWLHLHADYLVHRFDILSVKQGKLPVYYGIGGKVRIGERGSAGVRVPVGADYIFANAPLDIFAEVVLLIDLVPDTDVGLGGAVGIRYFF